MLIKRLCPDFVSEDSRGKLIQLVHAGYQQVNYIFSKGNMQRGGHYHKCNREIFYVIRGSFRLEVSSLAGDETQSVIFRTGDMFELPVNILHTFSFLEDTMLISMYDIGVEMSDGSMDIHTVEG